MASTPPSSHTARRAVVRRTLCLAEIPLRREVCVCFLASLLFSSLLFSPLPPLSPLSLFSLLSSPSSPFTLFLRPLTPHPEGLLPRIITRIFEEVKGRESFRIQLSFAEIYNENIYDLLDPKKKTLPIEHWTPVQIFESDGQLVMRNLSIFEVSSEEEALSLFFLGTNNRITSSTPMNEASSRSHAIFSIVCESEVLRGGNLYFCRGKLNVVDLAGSERMYKTKNSQRMMSEARAINLSLHYLEQVIITLKDVRDTQEEEMSRKGRSKGGKRGRVSDASRHSFASSSSSSSSSVSDSQHPASPSSSSPSSLLQATTTNHKRYIPYRNSILTSMLRDSLGGNCRTCFLLTISVESSHFGESISTCRFGQRCGEVICKVHHNAERSLIERLKEAEEKARALQVQVEVMKEENVSLELSIKEKSATVESLNAQKEMFTTEDAAKCDSFFADMKVALSHSRGDMSSTSMAEQAKRVMKGGNESYLSYLCLGMAKMIDSMQAEENILRDKIDDLEAAIIEPLAVVSIDGASNPAESQPTGTEASTTAPAGESSNTALDIGCICPTCGFVQPGPSTEEVAQVN